MGSCCSKINSGVYIGRVVNSKNVYKFGFTQKQTLEKRTKQQKHIEIITMKQCRNALQHERKIRNHFRTKDFITKSDLGNDYIKCKNEDFVVKEFKNAIGYSNYIICNKCKLLIKRPHKC